MPSGSMRLHGHSLILIALRDSTCECTVIDLSIQCGHVGAFQLGVIVNSAATSIVHFFW